MLDVLDRSGAIITVIMTKINPKIANSKNVSIQTFWEMFDNQKHDWIVNAFAKEGFVIRGDAVEEILFSVDNENSSEYFMPAVL